MSEKRDNILVRENRFLRELNEHQRMRGFLAHFFFVFFVSLELKTEETQHTGDPSNHHDYMTARFANLQPRNPTTGVFLLHKIDSEIVKCSVR